MSYYKWAERNAANTINWAEVSKSIYDTIKDETELREKTKGAIDDATKEMADVIMNKPMGSLKTGNDIIHDFSGDAQEWLLSRNRMMKAGIISPKEYMKGVSNLNSSTEYVFNLQKTIQDEFARRQKLYNENKTSKADLLRLQQMENLGSMKNMRYMLDPMSGQVQVGVWNDGVDRGVDPDRIMSAMNMAFDLNNEIQRVDYNAELSKFKEQIGKRDRVLIDEARKAGMLNTVMTMSDPTGEAIKNKIEGLANQYNKALKDERERMIKAIPDLTSYFTIDANGDVQLDENAIEILDKTISSFNSSVKNMTASITGGNPDRKASLLLDNFEYNRDGEIFELVFGEEGKRKFEEGKAREAREDGYVSNIIYFDPEESDMGSNVFTDAQEKYIEEISRDRIITSLDITEKVTTPMSPFAPQPSATQVKTGQNQTRSLNVVTALSKLWGGSAADINSAEGIVNSLGLDVRRTDDGIQIGIPIVTGTGKNQVTKIDYQTYSFADYKGVQDFVEAVYNKIYGGKGDDAIPLSEVKKREREMNKYKKRTSHGQEFTKIEDVEVPFQDEVEAKNYFLQPNQDGTFQKLENVIANDVTNPQIFTETGAITGDKVFTSGMGDPHVEQVRMLLEELGLSDYFVVEDRSSRPFYFDYADGFSIFENVYNEKTGLFEKSNQININKKNRANDLSFVTSYRDREAKDDYNDNTKEGIQFMLEQLVKNLATREDVEEIITSAGGQITPKTRKRSDFSTATNLKPINAAPVK